LLLLLLVRALLRLLLLLLLGRALLRLLLRLLLLSLLCCALLRGLLFGGAPRSLFRPGGRNSRDRDECGEIQRCNGRHRHFRAHRSSLTYVVVIPCRIGDECPDALIRTDAGRG
jgi:hypothetical protein